MSCNSKSLTDKVYVNTKSSGLLLTPSWLLGVTGVMHQRGSFQPRAAATNRGRAQPAQSPGCTAGWCLPSPPGRSKCGHRVGWPAGPRVGQILHWYLNVHLSQHQDLFMGYGHLFSGSYIKNTAKTPSAGDDNELFYVQYSFRW